MNGERGKVNGERGEMKGERGKMKDERGTVKGERFHSFLVLHSQLKNCEITLIIKKSTD